MGTSSFAKMYNLVKYSNNNRFEDYLTEVIAPIFNKKEILHSYIKKFCKKDLDDIRNITVSTQKTYKKLDGHEVDSRPDLVITLNSKRNRYIIFVENKLDARVIA